MFLLLLSLTLALLHPQVTVRPTVLFEGTTAHVKCRIPRREENRSVRFGIDGAQLSTRQVDAASGPITYDLWIEDIPCAVVSALCELTDSADRVMADRRPMRVVCRGQELSDPDSF